MFLSQDCLGRKMPMKCDRIHAKMKCLLGGIKANLKYSSSLIRNIITSLQWWNSELQFMLLSSQALRYLEGIQRMHGLESKRMGNTGNFSCNKSTSVGSQWVIILNKYKNFSSISHLISTRDSTACLDLVGGFFTTCFSQTCVGNIRSCRTNSSTSFLAKCPCMGWRKRQ